MPGSTWQARWTGWCFDCVNMAEGVVLAQEICLGVGRVGNIVGKQRKSIVSFTKKYSTTMCDFQKCRSFFDDYDRNLFPDRNDTRGLYHNPDLTEAEKRRWAAVIEDMAKRLNARRAKRAKAAKNGDPPPGDFGNDLKSEDVGMLSRLQLPLYFRHFSDGRGGIDFNEVQCCFEKFANGELRDPGGRHGPGEPDSEFFFLFAEFALAAMEFGYDRDIWAELLRTFVKCQEIYISAYPPATGPVKRPFNQNGQVSEERKKELRDKYDDKNPPNLERLYGGNLEKASEQKPASRPISQKPEDDSREYLVQTLESLIAHLHQKDSRDEAI